MSAPPRVRIRARYPETDRMGVVHHSHYLVWFEIGRTELMRERGVPYAALEQDGIFMPVVEAQAQYLSPVRYDEEVEVETTLTELTRVRVSFGYRLFKPPDTDLLATGFTRHAAVDGAGVPRRMPAALLDKLRGALEAGREEAARR